MQDVKIRHPLSICHADNFYVSENLTTTRFISIHYTLNRCVLTPYEYWQRHSCKPTRSVENTYYTYALYVILVQCTYLYVVNILLQPHAHLGRLHLIHSSYVVLIMRRSMSFKRVLRLPTFTYFLDLYESI
jgi:hypothetical protein